MVAKRTIGNLCLLHVRVLSVFRAGRRAGQDQGFQEVPTSVVMSAAA